MPLDNLIDGHTIAAQILGELTKRVAALRARGDQLGFACVRVGEDPALKVYVGRNERTCAELGILSETHILPKGTSEEDLLALLARLNADARMHGILVQGPLPPCGHLDRGDGRGGVREGGHGEVRRGRG